MLKTWINQDYLKNVSKLNKQFNTNKPFPHLELKGFFNSNKLKMLLKEIKKLEFEEKDGDLFYMLQTKDLRSYNIQITSEFLTLFSSKEFLSLIEKLTGIKGLNYADAASLIFPKTGYLLPHDDRLETRKIAYILNLSKNFTEKDGGALEFFVADENNNPKAVVKSIIPQFNNFIIFNVSERSFHQVSEQLTNKLRITIGGWFNERAAKRAY